MRVGVGRTVYDAASAREKKGTRARARTTAFGRAGYLAASYATSIERIDEGRDASTFFLSR